MTTSIDDFIDGIVSPKLPELPPLKYPETIVLSRYALEKAHAISDLVAQHCGSIEWYALLLATDDDLSVVKELLIPEQKNTPAHTKAVGAALGKALHELKETNSTYTAVGWIHSHVDFSTFFSFTDKENILNVLNTVQVNTRKPYAQKLDGIQGTQLTEVQNNALVIGGTARTDLRLHVTGAEQTVFQELAKKGVTVGFTQPILMGWSYNVVINNNRDSYAEIAVAEEIRLEQKKFAWTKKADIVIKDDERIVDREQLAAEIIEKVRKPEPEPEKGLLDEVVNAIFGQFQLPSFDYKPQQQPEQQREALTRENIYSFLCNFMRYEPRYALHFKTSVFDYLDELYKHSPHRGVLQQPSSPAGLVFNQELVAVILEHCKENDTFNQFVHQFNEQTHDFGRTRIIKKYIPHHDSREI